MLNEVGKKPPKAPKALTCDCYELCLYMIPSMAALDRGERSTIIPKRGKSAPMYINKDPTNENKIKVRVQTEKSEFNQTIELTKEKITFGVRRYLKCSCGRKVNSLFLRHTQFACRHCHDLAYEITRLKKGTWLYVLNKYFKIEAASNQVRNITYGKVGLTKKARRVITLIGKRPNIPINLEECK